MKNSSGKIVLSYTLISFCWIYFGSELMEYLFNANIIHNRHWLEVAKGSTFILISALLLYKLINYYYKNLEKSEEQYKNMFEKTPNPMWVYDLENYSFVKVNKATTLRYGYSEKEFMRMTLADICPPEEANRLKEFLTNRNEKELQSKGIWKNTLKDGSTINVNLISHTIIYNGRPSKLVLALDLSEKEQYEQQLERQQIVLQAINIELKENIRQLKLSQNTLYNTQRIAKIAGWNYNMTNGVFDFDAEFFKLTQIPRSNEPLSLEQLQPFIHADDFFILTDFINTFYKGAKEKECIVRIKNADDWLFMRFEAFLSSEESQTTHYLEGFTQNIDEIAKVNLQNKRLDEIINRIKTLVIITNQQGEIEWTNSSFYEITGYSSKETIGKKPWDIIEVPESSQKQIMKIKRAIENVEDFDVEIENLSREGRHFWLQIDGSPIYDENGNYAGYIAIENEITERKQKEAKIKEQNRLLDKAAWINSHQVRKPLASILGLIDLMSNTDNEQELQEYLRLLRICSNELDEIIKTSINITYTQKVD
ncbi:PAS domain S-box protein [Pseudopedobacter beijingensis]|uniref:histidine kinase n=1 Tax=Pseudopedobacter beijingensis TaxID=1207056 RepID=A0ABW4IA14_9SPHI